MARTSKPRRATSTKEARFGFRGTGAHDEGGIECMTKQLPRGSSVITSKVRGMLSVQGRKDTVKYSMKSQYNFPTSQSWGLLLQSQR